MFRPSDRTPLRNWGITRENLIIVVQKCSGCKVRDVGPSCKAKECGGCRRQHGFEKIYCNRKFIRIVSLYSKSNRRKKWLRPAQSASRLYSPIPGRPQPQLNRADPLCARHHAQNASVSCEHAYYRADGDDIR